MDPAKQAIGAIKTASGVAKSSTTRAFIDKVTGFSISRWEAEGEVVRQQILDEYNDAKKNGVNGVAKATELRQAANLINVAAKSAAYIDQDNKASPSIDNDFFWNTIEFAKTVSNEEVQDLLAKILAGEYNKQGTYSLRTLQILKNLDSELLDSFKEICSLVINGHTIPRQVFNLDKGLSSRPDYQDFQTLQSLGLILPNEMSLKTTRNKSISIPYQDKLLIFITDRPSDDTVSIPGYYALSSSGNEIFRLIKPKFNKDYYKWLKDNYKITGYKLRS
jgi:hypothetical protein